MSLLYEKVVQLIRQPAQDRTETDISHILPWFTKKSDLFKSLHTDIVRDIVKNCKFIQYTRDSVIIRQMDQGDCFYIILSGTVSIHINTTLTEEEYPQVKATQLQEEASWEKDTTGRPLDRAKYGIYVGQIDTGKSFGELALINSDCVRNATIIADENTDLLMVDRDLYNRCLRSFQVQELEQRKEFVRTFPMFQKWAPRYRKMMAYSLKKHILRFEDVIVRQGANLDGIHFIIKGSVKIRLDPSQHPHQYPQLYPLGDIGDLQKEKARELLRKEMNLQRQATVNKRSIYHRKLVADVKKSSLRSLELCFAAAIDVIGDLEMVVGLSAYSETVECMEESIIYHLDQRNYDRLIEKRNPQTVEMMKDIVHTKLALHFSRLQEDSIPLYRFFLYLLDEKEKEARMPRTKTGQEADAKIESLQKGPLINLFGPGSVFYLIRKRAKEMRKRQKRRAVPNSPFRLAQVSKVTANRGVMTGPFYQPMLGSGDTDNPDSQSTTASMINLYGAAQDAHLMQSLEDKDVLDDCGHEDVYEHWASSDPALSQLEKRLTQWHNSLPTAQRGACVVPLHRYQLEDENKPRPGNKIYVRLRSKTGDFFASANPAAEEEVEGGAKPSSPSSSHTPVLVKPRDVMSDLEDRVKTSMEYPRPASTRSEPSHSETPKQEKHKQYTAAEYRALKTELRRRQKAWISLLPFPAAAVL